jgi:putative drug exporter of the RND superfamily
MERVGTFARLVSGRWTKWIVFVVWLGIAMVAGPLSAKLIDVQKNEAAQWLPGNAESSQVLELQERFQTSDTSPAVIVYERESGITADDESQARAAVDQLAGVEGVAGEVVGPIESDDGQALQLVVPVDMSGDGFAKSGDRVDGIIGVVGEGGDGLSVYVAGPVGIAGEASKAFEGIDGTLMMVTLIVVIAILLLTYRSPVLWLLPVMAAGIALTTSQGVIYLLAKNADLTVSGQSAGILMVLVFGAGTDYALLLVARYREELRKHADRHEAMAIAVHRAGPAILASAATVAVGMLVLMFAEMNSTAGLGPVAAIGIVVGVTAMLTLLPALLVIFGRWVFWPSRPTFGVEERTGETIWDRLGAAIARRPRRVWVTTALVLALATIGVGQLNPAGLFGDNAFVDKPAAIQGQEVLGKHFLAGQGQPVVVIGNAGAADELREAISSTPGIAEVSEPITRDGLVWLDGTMQDQPDSQAAKDTVDRVRDAVHAVEGADAKVGGETALTMDVASASRSDNILIIPLVLLALLLILGVLLRAVVAPLVLIGTVVLSFGAALGISSFVFTNIFGFEATDAGFPLYVFVFLVALGIDYNIFLMTRVREEALVHGNRRGMLIGLSTTGGVITSAGLVLAGTFAAFGALPLVFFVELGFAVALGVLLDTLVVRSILVTGLTLDIGPKMWWPSALARKADAPETSDPSESEKPALVS